MLPQRSRLSRYLRTILRTLAKLLAWAQSASSAATGYTVVAVGPFHAGPFNTTGSNEATDVNNLNQVVGEFMVTYLQRHGFRWVGGVNTDLGTLGGGSSSADAINDAGVITGWAEIMGGYSRAFVYTSGAMQNIGTITGWDSSGGAAIDGAGRVVGRVSNFGTQNGVGFLWSGTSMAQLPSLGGNETGPTDINAAGTIVGGSKLANGHWRAFAYAGGVMSDLGTLPGDADSIARGMNDAGVIVGYSSQSAQQVSAVTWSAGTISNLGGLPGGTWALAEDVNSAGVVVGGSMDSNGVQRAVSWSGGAIVDLNTQIAAGSGWFLTSAAAINDNGWIVGGGTLNGVDRAFVLIPGLDTTPPSISCGSADGLWHPANVSIACTASDSGSGLANAADASFTLATAIAAGTETANASTGTRTVCDNAGNCAVAGPITGNKIDRKPPSIAITVPANTTYPFNSLQHASYVCTDGGSGVASCTGTVANGAAIDTSSVGAHTFTVTAADAVGNTSSTTVQYQVVATNWSQFHNGPDHLGTQPTESVLDPTNVGGLHVAWSAATFNVIFSSPAVVDGVAYIGSTDGHLYAFSAANGTQLWRAIIGTSSSSASSSPAVANGRVFIGSDNGDVYAFAAGNGAQLWTHATGGPVYAAPVVEGATVYVGSWDGNLYALDAAAGTLRWSQSVGDPIRAACSVAGGVVYVGSEDLNALGAQNGTVLWTAGIPTSVSSTPALPGLVLVGADDGNLYAIDTSGTTLWTAATSGAVVSSPATDGSLVYVGSNDGYLHAFDLNTGASAWSRLLGGWVVSSPAYANGVVYVGSLGAANAVDAGSGRLLWTYALPGSVVDSSPAVADGTLYIGADDHHLYAFRL